MGCGPSVPAGVVSSTEPEISSKKPIEAKRTTQNVEIQPSVSIY